MPLPENQQAVETGKALVATLHGAFGEHPGIRPAHGKGILLKGTFTPTETAKSLSIAKHFNDASTPILARFSDFPGLPDGPDNDPNANPRGFAVRFNLGLDTNGRRVHTDIVSHATPFFAVRTGQEFLEFLQAQGSSEKLDAFLASHPSAVTFVQAPKPTPSGFNRQSFFAVSAFKLIDAEDKETYVRYRFNPEAGEDHLDEAALKEKGPNFLFDDIPKILEKGPIRTKFMAQIAEAGDVTNDATVHWPQDRKVVELGVLELSGIVEDNAEEQRKIIFDPVPRVSGVEPSDDPLFDVRGAAYLISGRERRAAHPAQSG